MPINLIDTKTGGNLSFNTPEEAESAIISGQADFSPKESVYVKDYNQGVIRVPGPQASNNIRLGTPGFVIASDEDVQNALKEEQYKGPVQQGLAAAQGVIGSVPFGKSLARVGIELATPRGSTLGKDFIQGTKERSEVYPGTELAGEIAGIVADPTGVFKGLENVGKAAGKIVAPAVKVAAESKITPKIAEKIINSGVGKAAVEKGAAWGTEGALIEGAYETDRQLQDGLPLNAEAIAGRAGKGFIIGGGAGAVIGGGGQAMINGYNKVKREAKSYIDKVTSPGKDLSGDIVRDVHSSSLKKETGQDIGLKKPFIRATENADGSIVYKNGKDTSVLNIDNNANGLDLSNDNDVLMFGDKIGISSLDTKIKNLEKRADENLSEILSEELYREQVSKKLNSIKQYLPDNDKILLEQANEQRQKMFRGEIEFDRKLYNDILSTEEDILLRGSKEQSDYLQYLQDNYKANESKIAKELESYDYVKTLNQDGQKTVHILNEGVLPEINSLKSFEKGLKTPSYIGGQMAKQYKMTPSQMRKMGGDKLNEVSEFILDNYPKSGNIVSRATTDVDIILENIANAKQTAGKEIGDLVEQAFNREDIKSRITTKDIADKIETEILPQFIDPSTGNPKAGFKSEHKIVSDLAEEYRNNGYRADKYGRKEYIPLDIKELREIRKKLDDKAKFSTENPSTLQAAARELRTILEDQVISQVKKSTPQIVESYNKAKKTYSLATDAQNIVAAAVNKAAKRNNFSIFYSGVGAGVGASIAGAPGALIGGYVGGKINNAIREYSGNLHALLAKDLAKNVDSYERKINSAAKMFFSPAKVIRNVYMRIPKSGEDENINTDMTRLMKEIQNKEEYINDFIDNNEALFSAYPETSQAILATVARAREFLFSKIPKNPYAGNPFKESTWTPSRYELDKYLRYRDAVSNPMGILDQISGGYVTPEAIEVLDMVYPETKAALAESFVNYASNASKIPVEKRVELFKIFGIQSDSFMSGKNFMQLQQDSNGQAATSAAGNGSSEFRPQNASKTSLGKRDSTLGNSTLK